jgi:hypothetical protein
MSAAIRGGRSFRGGSAGRLTSRGILCMVEGRVALGLGTSAAAENGQGLSRHTRRIEVRTRAQTDWEVSISVDSVPGSNPHHGRALADHRQHSPIDASFDQIATAYRRDANGLGSVRRHELPLRPPLLRLVLSLWGTGRRAGRSSSPSRAMGRADDESNPATEMIGTLAVPLSKFTRRAPKRCQTILSSSTR